ncbi:MAG: haloacid dehalogenase-like hydrolase [Thaumarchaeota archaeon]|nr:haloacid dehalogenase-like hydrolase [Nitrososphaerota archaeon]
MKHSLIFALILSIGFISIIPLSDATEFNQICIDKVWIESTKGKIACVTPSTAEKLVERGWGTLFDEDQFATNSQSNPLPSWNSGNSKQKIIEFVDKVTNPSSPAFVPAEDRIATFDNDGTLWIEQPLYIPFAFHLEYLYEQLENNPSLASQSPYSEILEKKDSLSNQSLDEIPGLVEILLPAYPDITQEEYLQKSKDYLDNTKHARYNVALKELTYQPMVELVHYLQENDFNVYIVSAGFQGLMRSISEEAYNIEKENVIGTHPKFVYELTENGPVLIRQPVLASFNDGAEKPVNIQKFIGKIPIFACGNSGGDIEMLMLTHFHENHFACMLNHDDEEREYNYPNSEALEESKQNDWLVISMKNDFKTVFSSSQEKIEYECSTDFWKNNLELWGNIGVDYNDDFDETFGKDNFEPDITLEQAINAEGLGLNHLARSGTTAYLNALLDPEIDENAVKSAVYFGYIHQIDNYLENCKKIEK